MIRFLTYLGANLSLFLYMGVWFIAFGFIRVQWQCGLCGKFNTTNLFKFLLLMCGHEGV